MMKPEDLFQRIGEADERYVADAKTKRKRPSWIPVSAVAAALVLAILVGAFLQPWSPTSVPGAETTGGSILENETTGGSVLENETTGRYFPQPIEPNVTYDAEILKTFALSMAEYPVMTQRPKSEDGYELFQKWYADRSAQRAAYDALDTNAIPNAFLYAAMQAFLSGSREENAVCSPVNIYMALAMLAETTSGETRAEILDVLGAESIEALRTTASAMWNAHYCDDGEYMSVLGSSLWLAEDLSYREETVNRLAETYYASVFRGKMGSDEYNEALRAWLDTQTGGILSDQIEKLKMNPTTLLAIATTVYFRAGWFESFEAKNNTEAIFHAVNGDVLCEFMNAERVMPYYWGERFSSVSLDFESGGRMHFLLPDEGVTAESLLSDAEVISLLSAPREYKNKKTAQVALSIPKFDASSQIDLQEGLETLGIRSVFAGGDFSAIMDRNAALSEAKHGARVTIDEDGCVAAAFTLLVVDESEEFASERVTFTVDRPFVFVITSEVGAPLFVGVVNVMQ